MTSRARDLTGWSARSAALADRSRWCPDARASLEGSSMLSWTVFRRLASLQCWIARLVEGLVVSLIRYCVTVCGTANKTQLSRLQRILNLCARVILSPVVESTNISVIFMLAVLC